MRDHLITAIAKVTENTLLGLDCFLARAKTFFMAVEMAAPPTSDSVSHSSFWYRSALNVGSSDVDVRQDQTR